MRIALVPFVLSLLFQSNVFAQPAPGSMAPDIALPDSKGVITRLSDYRGKVVLLDFWASWCGPCRHSNQGMKPIYKKYQEKGFEIFAVSVDDRASAWQNAIKQDKITWPQVIDNKATANSNMLRVWNVRYIPSTFLIDKEGKIIAVNPDKGELVKLLKDQL